MPGQEYEVELKHIYKKYEGVEALQDVSLSVMPGEVHALMGENGAGKSTLIKVLSGATQPDKGEVFIRGEKAHITKPKDSINYGVSVIYQEFALFQHLSVTENIYIDELREGSHLVKWKQLREKTKQLLSELGFGNISPNAKIWELSVAYQQVVEICKALSRNTSILVLDEPTTVLTFNEVERLLELIKTLKDKGVAIIYVSHRLGEVFRVSNRITVLKDGKFVRTINTAETTEGQLVNLMIGRDLQTYFPERDSNIGAPILKVSNIQAGIAVKDISFEVHEGEVLGLSGLVGAGRTEAVRAVLGIDRMDQGKVELDGKAIHIRSPKHAFLLGIGLLPEDRKTQGVMLNLSIKQNITLSCLRNFCNLIGVIKLKKEKRFTDDFAQKISIKTVSLENKVNSLSGGNQQKVAIARLLASNCKVLILDEPTRGVDVGAKIEIFNIINSMVAQHYAVVLISSEMSEIIGMCDRAVVIREGKTVGVLDKESLTEQNIINYSMGVN